MIIENISKIVCLLFFIQACSGTNGTAKLAARRIKNGMRTVTDKRYAAYLVKAPPSPRDYLGWLCGGAIVSEWYIVTSAACVEDVEHLYAISGYKKYVRAVDIETDTCTSQKKKKVVFTCVPKMYEFDYHSVEKWANTDIAVVKVESKFDFYDETYLTLCSFIPNKIEINFESKYQEQNTDAMALGWGHEMYWRKADDERNYNAEYLNYAPMLIVNKEECKATYSTKIGNIIDKYMICASGVGNINEKGLRITNVRPENLADGCEATNKDTLREIRDEECEDDNNGYSYEDDGPHYRREGDAKAKVNDSSSGYVNILKRMHSRRDGDNGGGGNGGGTGGGDGGGNGGGDGGGTGGGDGGGNGGGDGGGNGGGDGGGNRGGNVGDRGRTEPDPGGIHDDQSTLPTITSRTKPKKGNNTDKGICQNDHGGPLVTWAGAQEILIGVATAFLVDETNACHGPYLFTSTQCSGAFLDCIVNADRATDQRRIFCENPDASGFDTIRRDISWKKHPAGPAENEILEERPQVPLNKLNSQFRIAAPLQNHTQNFHTIFRTQNQPAFQRKPEKLRNYGHIANDGNDNPRTYHRDDTDSDEIRQNPSAYIKKHSPGSFNTSNKTSYVKNHANSLLRKKYSEPEVISENQGPDAPSEGLVRTKRIRK